MINDVSILNMTSFNSGKSANELANVYILQHFFVSMSLISPQSDCALVDKFIIANLCYNFILLVSTL